MTELTLSADLSEVDRMNAWYGKLVQAAGTPQGLTGDMKLCLNEAVANVIAYAFDDPSTAVIRIEVTASADEIHAVVEDNGRPFDPVAAPVSAPLTDLATAPIGGFGIKLIRETADHLTYERRDGRNRLSITCRLSPSA